MGIAVNDWKTQTTKSFLEVKMLFEKLRNYEPESLLIKPSESRWNADECLQHLNSYACYYLPQLTSAIEKSKSKGYTQTKEVKGSWIGRKFTHMMNVNEFGMPNGTMKSPKDHRPKLNVNTPKTLQEFEIYLNEIEKIIVECNKINVDKTRIPISISRFIKLPAGDVLDFYLAHQKRHLHQALRAVEEK